MPKDSPDPLSLEQMNLICRALFPIADRLFENMKALEEKGFVAWRPYHDFIESFANNPTELATHRTYLVEAAKHSLAMPWLLVGRAGRFYSSPFIENLCEERDRMNGAPDRELLSRYGGAEAAWRREVDPCLRRKVQTSIVDKEMFDAQWLAVTDEQRRVLQSEAMRFRTPSTDGFTFDPEGRYACFKGMMTQHAGAHGFSHDEARSSAAFPVFSKPLTKDWDLCWVLGDARKIALTPTEGSLELRLILLARNISAQRKAKFGHVIDIRYQHIIPGFGNAYLVFHHLDELETAVRAHLCLYQLMAPVIEPGLRDILAS